MKYVAHLSTGGTVEIEIDGDENLYAHIGGPSNNRNAGWLVGNYGEMVNLDYCAALVPVQDVPAETLAKATLPNTFVDSEGDWWRRRADDRFQLYTGTSGLVRTKLSETYEEIVKTYGIDRVVD